jgi:hypothetical protein
MEDTHLRRQREALIDPRLWPMTMRGLLDWAKTTFQVTGPLISGDFTRGQSASADSTSIQEHQYQGVKQ